MATQQPDEQHSFPGAFCEPCNKWRKPSFLMPDGSCPKCRTVLEHPVADLGAGVDGGQGRATPEAQTVKIPWHFWVMVAATALYLGWRVIQGIGALF